MKNWAAAEGGQEPAPSAAATRKPGCRSCGQGWAEPAAASPPPGLPASPAAGRAATSAPRLPSRPAAGGPRLATRTRTLATVRESRGTLTVTPSSQRPQTQRERERGAALRGPGAGRAASAEWGRGSRAGLAPGWGALGKPLLAWGQRDTVGWVRNARSASPGQSQVFPQGVPPESPRPKGARPAPPGRAIPLALARRGDADPGCPLHLEPRSPSSHPPLFAA